MAFPPSPQRTVLATLLVSALLAGCARSEFTPASAAPGDLAPYRGTVRVLPALPPGGFERLGVVIVRGQQNISDERLTRMARDAAQARGANAIVVQAPPKVESYRDGGFQKKLAAWALRLPE
ncbi:MAG: hypothetical protein H6983_25545 [Ectothiorhodospiraceae bacterium]|nr:hypothetical protein [Chromatiales bacterium]MCP5157566.1 hypothetical protein [Ectothiorhodospiraceae bacterium]